MNKITEELLEQVSDYKGEFKGAYNIRENGQCVGRQSSKNIRIEPKKDKSGIDIHIAPNTKGERVYIPACVTHSNVPGLQRLFCRRGCRCYYCSRLWSSRRQRG